MADSSKTVQAGPDKVITVRLINTKPGKPMPDAVIFASRLDMTPDGMKEMVTKDRIGAPRHHRSTPAEIPIPLPRELGPARPLARLDVASRHHVRGCSKMAAENAPAMPTRRAPRRQPAGSGCSRARARSGHTNGSG